MPPKRKYTLSDAALAQRLAASHARHGKRATDPPALAVGLYDLAWKDGQHIGTVDIYATKPHGLTGSPDIYAPLPKDAPNSEHQRRAALIRMHKIRTGELAGSSRGGRRKISRACTQCNAPCDSAREARDHCRQARTPKIVSE